MPEYQNALRHEQLFELLRQQNLCEDTNARLRARGFAREHLDQEEARALKSLAVSSWSALQRLGA